MTDEILDELAIERIAEHGFKHKLEIKQVIAHEIPTGRAAKATVFMTADHNVYVFIAAESTQLLDDVRKMINRMGLVADEFLPPRGDDGYFDAVGAERFRSVFPGRSVVSAEDLIFYRQLAPYNPALVRISAIKTGEIKEYVAGSSQWRTATKFSYRKIKASS